jgi:hypothetical protein
VLRAPVAVGLAALSIACGSGTDPKPQPKSRYDHLEIRLSPARAFYPVRDTVRATGIGVLPDGTTEVLVSHVTWRVLDPTLASIDNAFTPLMTVLGRGTATLEVQAEGLTARVPVLLKGLLHDAKIVSSETWRAADAPHVVQGFLGVGGTDTAVVTIEPGASGSEVIFRAGSGLKFGEFRAEPGRVVIPAGGGTVAMSGDPAVQDSWIGLYLEGAGRSELRNVTFRHCGAAPTFEVRGGCVLAARNAAGFAPSVVIDGVTITGAREVGITLGNEVTLAAGSRNLTVTGTDGHPATVSADIAGRMPQGGRYDGNAEDAIWISTGLVERSTTLFSVGVPWRIAGGLTVQGPAEPVLTIPAGSVVRVDGVARIAVGVNGRGSLVVGDPAGAPVTFEPSGSAWTGILLSDGANPSSLYHVVMRDCGNADACLTVFGGSGTGSRVFVQDVTIRNSRTVGVRLTAEARFEVGSSGLTITGSADVPLVMPPDAVPSVPPGSYLGNTLDVIRLYGYEVTRSATWVSRGLPILAPQGLFIWHPNNDPLLTIERGVTLQLGPSARVVAAEEWPGALEVRGTADAPVRFSAVTPGVPGSWMGVELGNHGDSRTRFNYLEILDAGAGEAVPYAGAVRLQVDPGGVLRNTTVRRSSSCGVVLFNGNSYAEDYTAPPFGNTFTELGGPALCRQP